MAFADESTLQMAENYAAGDEKLMVRFYLRPMKDDALSLKEGRPIFVDAEYIEIMVPGDKDNTINRPLRDEDKSRFRKLYENWSVTGKQAVIGTPLEAWPQITRAQCEELKFFNVTTVEALANLADVYASRFMGLHDLKKKAAAFMVAAAGDAPNQKMQEELAKRDETIATLQASLQEQSNKIEQLLKQRR